MKPILPTMLAVALLAGCGLFPGLRPDRAERPPQRPETAVRAGPSTVVAPPRRVTATPASFDTVSEAEKREAREAAARTPAAALGPDTVSLGDPTDPGLWVKTSKVAADTPGTVTTGGGAAVAVTLRPLAGTGGAQISLSALQALGLPLAGLHAVVLARAP